MILMVIMDNTVKYTSIDSIGLAKNIGFWNCSLANKSL